MSYLQKRDFFLIKQANCDKPIRMCWELLINNFRGNLIDDLVFRFFCVFLESCNFSHRYLRVCWLYSSPKR